MERLSPEQITLAAKRAGHDPAAIRAVLQVETGGRGFDPATGKILIQFEPAWFNRYFHEWINNGVRPQAEEWRAFNQAWNLPGIDAQTKLSAKTAAMLATSWGLPQIMGFHYKRLGYAEVGEMVDDFKKGEDRQLAAMIRFIDTDTPFRFAHSQGGNVVNKTTTLGKALKEKDWAAFAFRYNGQGYAKNEYDTKLAAAYARLSAQKITI